MAETCTEFSESCDYNEHKKCSGHFTCPQNGQNEWCSCMCHYQD